VLRQHSKIVTIPRELRVIVDPDGILDLISDLTERWTPNRADVAIGRFKKLISKGCKRTFILRVARRLEQNKFWPLTMNGYYETLSGFGNEFVRARTDKLMQDLITHQSEAEMVHSPPYRFRSTVYESGPFDKEELCELLQDYVNDLYSNVAQSNTTCWLDDTPLSILCALELAALFKDMKLIHIYRDPRDVVSSYFTQRWGGDELETIAKRVAGIYRQWQQIKSGLPSEQFIEINLDELAASPKPTLQRICDHAGIEFEEGLLEIKLDKTNSGRWKSDIPAKDLETVLGHLNPFLGVYASSV
jgi:hypothetical protein